MILQNWLSVSLLCKFKIEMEVRMWTSKQDCVKITWYRKQQTSFKIRWWSTWVLFFRIERYLIYVHHCLLPDQKMMTSVFYYCQIKGNVWEFCFKLNSRILDWNASQEFFSLLAPNVVSMKIIINDSVKTEANPALSINGFPNKQIWFKVEFS